MVAHVKQSRLAGHILDGPRGPAGKVKAGVIRLAHATDSVIVPFTITAGKGWYLNSWDRFLLPKPFSKVFLRFGKMIKLDKVIDEEVFEKQRLRLEEIMLPALKP